MEQYIVTGMSCAACQSRVEKAVSKVPGVTSCSVSLLTNSMGVEGTASDKDIIDAVTNAGYGASKKESKKQLGGGLKPDSSQGLSGGLKSDSGPGSPYADEEEALKDRETPVLKRRLVSSLVFLLALMYISMGHMMLKLPLPGFLEENHVALATTEMLIAIIVMTINHKFFTSGFKSLLAGAPNMDTLVALGSAAAFGYSLVELYAMIIFMGRGENDMVSHYVHNLYFESAAMIPTLITIGKLLESISKGRTTDALKGLMRLAPKTAILFKDGRETEVLIENVRVGDIFVVRAGENIPVDGVIVEGSATVNEAALTGESIPVDKAAGDTISAATTNQSGYIRARATRVGEDTTLSQIIHMVSDAAATKAPIARIADKVSSYFVPAVIIISLITLIIWLVSGQSFTFAIARAIAVLVISCPCALGLATPVAIMVGNGIGAKNGILFKTAAAQEKAGKISTVALDKTGTLTRGEPVVTDIVPADTFTADELLRLAVSLEQKSEHPLAKAIVQKATEEKNIADEVSDFTVLPGNGLKASKDDLILYGGSAKYISKHFAIPQKLAEAASALAMQGRTPLFFAAEKKLRAMDENTSSAAGENASLVIGENTSPTIGENTSSAAGENASPVMGENTSPAVTGKFIAGIIAVADTLKDDSVQAVEELKNMGISVVMLTGDNKQTANAIGRLIGVDNVIAGVLPDGKDEVVQRLSESGVTAMVGDGINDAPALTRADLGIAIGAGADVAVDAADIVLMKSGLTDVPAAIRLSRATIKNIHQNLFWAFFYNIICIPLAAGFYQKLFGWHWEMSPMLGAAAMSLSSFTVCMNALRLNLLDIHDSSKDKNMAFDSPNINLIQENYLEKEKMTMTKTMKIEGMMCKHCEAAVKKALEAIDGVENADVSHVEGTAVVTLSGDINNDILKKAVEDKDYNVIDIA
ncbi:MAG: heavy metal translocating P-type ATPase [Lachnospiraceae bacterium]|nr:heavy metal translocating P-type ATPase [Lachnospiraceae bacterium]